MHALVPALGSGGMKVSANLFVLFPAKISYAGEQGAEDPPVRHAELVSASLYSSRRFWRDPESSPIAIGPG